MDEKFDAIIVGGGIAGLSAAMTLARGGARFLLIERGEFCGAKNVSGGVLWGSDLARLVPEYWLETGGIERFVNHRQSGERFFADFEFLVQRSFLDEVDQILTGVTKKTTNHSSK